MTPMSLGLFVKKLQPKVGLVRYDILFAYFVVEAKSKMGYVTPIREAELSSKEKPLKYSRSRNFY